MGSNISLTIPQPERSNSTYAQSNPRLKKNNFYVFSALFMEHFVDFLSPFDEVLNKIEEDRKKFASTTVSDVASFAKNRPRVSKENLYMITALWMEDFVNKFPELDKEKTNEPEKRRKKSFKDVGAVLVSPNDVVFAADCSREGVHAVARLLMKHYEKAEGSKMFLSRKPCPLCTKLLVQAKVKQVLYLPFEPEYYLSPGTEFNQGGRTAIEKIESNSSQKKQVDHMFNANPIAQTRFVLEVDKDVLNSLRETPSSKEVKDNLVKKYTFPTTNYEDEWLEAIKEDLKNFDALKDEIQVPENKKKNFSKAIEKLVEVKSMKELTTDTAKKDIDEIKRAYFPQDLKKFDKEEIKEKVRQYNQTIESLTTVENYIKEQLPLQAFDDKIKKEVEKKFENAADWAGRVAGECSKYQFEVFPTPVNPDNEANPRPSNFNPVAEPHHQEQARHLMAIAQFLAQRTDDPKTGVGAVIVSPKMENVALGWNGFPLKAQYGEFPRASDKDEDALDKKYPYVIHAEQNALLMRNTKNIKDSILLVTKSPCHECAPLIAMEGISTVVTLSDKKKTTENVALDYDMFSNMAENGTFTCYQTKMPE